MPIEFKIDHDRRFIHTHICGIDTRLNIEAYLDDAIVVRGAIPYCRPFDCTDVVAVTDEAIEATDRCFMNPGGAKRPAKLFWSATEAQKWLEIQEES